ncbi:MAG TPA: fibronectin type III domain-containing protein [Chloroflexota bacterium]|jgi:fibronectin type 3 domain-containing protein
MQRGVQRTAIALVAACAAQGGAAAAPAREAQAQACNVELTLDQPSEGAEVSARQRISGWAVDRAAQGGTGIEAVRVALDPAPSGDDQLYMPLVYGVARPDVAYTLGNPSFASAGFAQDWAAVGTPPGRHRLVVQAKSACGWTTLARAISIAGTPPGTDTIQEVPVRLPTDDNLPVPIVPPAGGAPGLAALDRTPPVPVAVTRPHFPLNANASAPTVATLSWNAVPGAASYNVYAADESVPDAPQNTGRATNPRAFGVAGLARVRSNLTDTSVTLSNLNAGDPYRFTVRAVGQSGSEITSSDVARVTLPAGADTTLTATATNGTVALSWAAVPNAASYRVMASSNGGPMVPDPDRASLTDSSVSIDHLPPGSYTFQIDARDGTGGRIARSNQAQVTIDGSGSAVSSVAGAAAPAVAAPSGNPAAVGSPFASAPGATAPPAPGAPPAAVGPVPGGPLAGLPLPGAPPAGLAIPPAAGPGGVPLAAPGGMPPGAVGPAGLSGGAGGGFPLNLTRTGADGVRLEWPPIPGAATYAVYQAQGSTPLAFAFSTDIRTNTTLTGLSNPAGYQFQVRARNAADQEISSSITVNIPPSQ